MIAEAGDWPYNPVCYFASKRVYDAIGPFPEKYHYTMDYWWLLRALRFTQVVYSDHVFGCFHNTGQNKTARDGVCTQEKYRVLRRFLCTPRGARFLPLAIRFLYRVRHRVQFPGRSSLTILASWLRAMCRFARR